MNSLRPVSLDEALKFRAETNALPFAGGTDLMVQRRRYSGTAPHFEEPILFLDAVEALRNIAIKEGELRIGATITLAEILTFNPLPELIRRSIADIAAPGLRNRATLAGNICNASPAGDSLPPLYVHEAVLVLLSIQGERLVPARTFFTGPGATVLAENEILTEVRIPLLEEGLCYFRKVGTRKANALSKLSAAGFARKNNNRITDFRFALGAVAPTVVRLDRVEHLVKNGERGATVLEAAAGVIHPIDDQRSTAAYRKRTALKILEEFLHIIEDGK